MTCEADKRTLIILMNKGKEVEILKFLRDKALGPPQMFFGSIEADEKGLFGVNIRIERVFIIAVVSECDVKHITEEVICLGGFEEPGSMGMCISLPMDGLFVSPAIVAEEKSPETEEDHEKRYLIKGDTE
jgi:hypothetical protein